MTVSWVAGALLGPIAARARDRLPHSTTADVAILAPLAAFAATQAESSSLSWLRLALLLFVVGRVLEGHGKPGLSSETRGELHLLPFVAVLAAGTGSGLDFWSWSKTLGALWVSATFITRQSVVERWAAVAFMLMPILGRFV